jgi:hypothetical protein
MEISDKLTQIANNVPLVYDAGYQKGKAEGGDTEQAYNQGVNAGKQAERQAFWDVFQNKGNQMDYYWAFGNNKFNDDTYNPIHPIKCLVNGEQSSQCMYRENRVLTDTKVEIIASTKNVTYCFLNAMALVTIRKLTVYESTLFTSTFGGCSELKHIDFGSKIGQSISFKDSPYLTTGKEGEVLDGEPSNSVQNIIDHLADLTGKTKQTLTLNAQVKVSEEQVAKINSLNWSLSQI